MLLLLLCKCYSALLLDPICIIIFCLEAFWNFMLIEFYFPVGLMIAYKLLRVIFQTGDVWEPENLSSSYILLYKCILCFIWPFPLFFEVFRMGWRWWWWEDLRKLAILIMLLFRKGRVVKKEPAKLFANLWF